MSNEELLRTEPAFIGGSSDDPTSRIGDLPATNKEPISVKPDTDLKEAVTLMLLYDFSQLPVMQSPWTVKGVISWKSIGSRLALGSACMKVRDCMEKEQVVPADRPLLMPSKRLWNMNTFWCVMPKIGLQGLLRRAI